MEVGGSCKRCKANPFNIQETEKTVYMEMLLLHHLLISSSECSNRTASTFHINQNKNKELSDVIGKNETRKTDPRPSSSD